MSVLGTFNKYIHYHKDYYYFVTLNRPKIIVTWKFHVPSFKNLTYLTLIDISFGGGRVIFNCMLQKILPEIAVVSCLNGVNKDYTFCFLNNVPKQMSSECNGLKICFSVCILNFNVIQ